jgi:hypothetical protein
MSQKHDPTEEIYRFSEEQWQRILKAIKDANPKAFQVDSSTSFRLALELCVSRFLTARKEEKGFDRQRARAALKRIVNSATKLRRELERLDKLAWHGPSYVGMPDLPDPRRDYRRWELLVDQLRETEELAAEQHSSLKKLKRPADLALELFCVQLAQLYEEATLRRASPSTAAPGAKNEGQVTGPFLRFMQAAASKIPGEKPLSSHQIRHFARHYNDI